MRCDFVVILWHQLGVLIHIVVIYLIYIQFESLDDEKANNPEETLDLPKKSNALAKTLKLVVDMARERDCPVLLAFKRRMLQKLCHKGAPVSCVGVINFAGVEDLAKTLVGKYTQSINTVNH